MESKVFQHQDEAFIVTENNCCLEVAIRGFDETVHIRVNSETPSRGKFELSTNKYSSLSHTINPLVVAACEYLIERRDPTDIQEAGDTFNHKAACDDLKRFVAELPAS